MRKSKDVQVELYIKAEEFVGDVLTEAFLKLTHTQYLELQMNLIDYISSFNEVKL